MDRHSLCCRIARGAVWPDPATYCRVRPPDSTEMRCYKLASCRHRHNQKNKLLSFPAPTGDPELYRACRRDVGVTISAVSPPVTPASCGHRHKQKNKLLSSPAPTGKPELYRACRRDVVVTISAVPPPVTPASCGHTRSKKRSHCHPRLRMI
jgi:hypothetical protein